MGVDAELIAEGMVTDARLAEAQDWCRAHLPYCERDGWQGLHRQSGREWRIEWRYLGRYYDGNLYKSGHWPDYYAAIVVLRAALPECKVFYGSDLHEHGTECTDEYLAEIWSRFLEGAPTIGDA